MAAHLGTMRADFELPCYDKIFVTYVGSAPPPISDERMALNLAELICEKKGSGLWELIQWDQVKGVYSRLKGTFLYIGFNSARTALRGYLWPKKGSK